MERHSGTIEQARMAGLAAEDVSRLRAARDLAAECRAQNLGSAYVLAMSEHECAQFSQRERGRIASPRTWALVVELLSWTEQVAKAGA